MCVVNNGLDREWDKEGQKEEKEERKGTGEGRGREEAGRSVDLRKPRGAKGKKKKSVSGSTQSAHHGAYVLHDAARLA